jgi:hypothetical protein
MLLNYFENNDIYARTLKGDLTADVTQRDQ